MKSAQKDTEKITHCEKALHYVPDKNRLFPENPIL
nr:MAG TPA: hypothetical protein [Caudoviricetes sp.]